MLEWEEGRVRASGTQYWNAWRFRHQPHVSRRVAGRSARLAMLACVLMNVGGTGTALSPTSSTVTTSREVDQDQVAFTSKTMLKFLTNTTDNFGGRTFVVAVHEQHPFVFFDCDYKLAVCGYSTQKGGSESCGVKKSVVDPLQCTHAVEESAEAQGEFSVRMVLVLPYQAPGGSANSSGTTNSTRFNANIEAKLKEAIARAVRKTSGSVHINNVTDPRIGASSAYGEHRRRLLAAGVSCHVDLSVDAESLEDAQAAASMMTMSRINAELAEQEINNLTSIFSDANVVEPVQEDFCTTEFPEDLSSSTPSNQLAQWACGRESDGQGNGKFRKVGVGKAVCLGAVCLGAVCLGAVCLGQGSCEFQNRY